ncbi:MAG: hypothetical protein AAF288_03195 [Planctomycetota bacterium]
MTLIQHIDFQPSGFAELPQGPTPAQADVALLQTPDAAAHPLPNPRVAQGLRATLSAGTQGQSLRLPVNSPPPILFTSVWVNLDQLVGGQAQILGAYTADGTTLAVVHFNPADQTLALQPYNASAANTPVPPGPTWRHLRLATTGAVAVLSIDNGPNFIRVGSGTPPPLAEVALGPRTKDASATGVIDFDHWRLASAPIDHTPLPPTGVHAGHADRWLVAYQPSSARSVAFASEYAKRRGVPPWNLAAISAPTSETISLTQYYALRDQLGETLETTGLRPHILGILLGPDLPVFVESQPGVRTSPVASLLQTENQDTAANPNPAYTGELGQRPTADRLGSARLAASFDFPDTTAVAQALDAADRTLTPLDAKQNHTVYLDPHPADNPLAVALASTFRDFTQGVGAQQLRLPLRTTSAFDAADPTRPDRFASVDHDAVYYGWDVAGPANNPTPFAEPAGPRLFFAQFDTEQPVAPSLRNPSANHWLGVAHAAGYAACAAATAAYSFSYAPVHTLFFEALRQGWTLAEAWAVATPFHRADLFFYGDPLLTVPFPKQGVAVLADLPTGPPTPDPEPIAYLSETQTRFTPSNPNTRFLLRSTDTQGRTERNRRTLDPSPSLAPAWPNRPDWPPATPPGRIRCAALWPSPVDLHSVALVALEADPPSAIATPPTPAAPKAHERSIVFEIDPPTQPVRLRFRIEPKDSSAPIEHTPWSRTVTPQTAEPAPAVFAVAHA